MTITKAELRPRLAIALLAFSLNSCATMSEVTSRNIRWYKQNTSVLDEQDLRSFLNNENEIVNDIAGFDQISVPPPNSDWKPFVRAGMAYSRDRCTKYLESVFYFNRVRAIGSRELTSTHVLAAAVLQATKAANALAAITAAGFNFGNETLENFGSALLYGIEPGTIRKLVVNEQDAFETTAEGEQFNNRTTAMEAVRKYTEICLPVHIEQMVNDKLSEAANSRSSAGANGEADGAGQKAVEAKGAGAAKDAGGAAKGAAILASKHAKKAG